MPQQFISGNGQKLVNNALKSTGLDQVGISNLVDKTGKQLNKQFKKTFGSEDTKNKIALEEQSEKDAKQRRADQVAYNNMSDEEKQAYDAQKSADERIKREQSSAAADKAYEDSDWGRQKAAEKAQEQALKDANRNVDAVNDRINREQDQKIQEDLYNNSSWAQSQRSLNKDGTERKQRSDAGKPRSGSAIHRPDNLRDIAVSVASGRNRKIGSRKGGLLDDILRDRETVAQDMYMRPYSELTENQKDLVDQQLRANNN